MDDLKYVVTEHNDFAIFSATVNHSDVARALRGKPVGAGFCNIRQKADGSEVDTHCYGESVTLNLFARLQDENIINKKLNPEY